MLARSLLVLLATVGTAHAAEIPDTVSVKKCRAHKKIFAALDDGAAEPRTIKISSAFYFQAGSIAVHGCSTFKGTGQCRESVDLGLLLAPGFTGELPCSALLYFNYGLMSEAGGLSESWTSTATNCTVTIVKNDPDKGRLKGTYRVELTGGSGPELAAGEIVGCFSAKRQDL
jgi:hypothetical protein